MVRKIGAGLTLQHMESQDTYILGIQYHTSLGKRNQYILKGDFLGKYEDKDIQELNNEITQSQEFKKIETLTSQLNLELKTNKATFNAKYGSFWKNNELDLQNLKIGGTYMSPKRNIYSKVGILSKEGKVNIEGAEAGISSKTKILSQKYNISASLKYNKESHQFSPNISIKAIL